MTSEVEKGVRDLRSSTGEEGGKVQIQLRSTRTPTCIYRTAPLLCPPLFATDFQEKEGGGRNNETCTFASQFISPPPTNLHTL